MLGLQTNPVTVLGLLDVSAVPKGGWLLHSAAASVRVPLFLDVQMLCASAAHSP